MLNLPFLTVLSAGVSLNKLNKEKCIKDMGDIADIGKEMIRLNKKKENMMFSFFYLSDFYLN